jgi:hypothetical protein
MFHLGLFFRVVIWDCNLGLSYVVVIWDCNSGVVIWGYHTGWSSEVVFPGLPSAGVGIWLVIWLVIWIVIWDVIWDVI